MSNYRRCPPGTIIRDKISEVFEFPGVGHRMTIFMDVYHNVAVSHAWWYENLAACLQRLAGNAAAKARELREREKSAEGPEETAEQPPHGLPAVRELDFSGGGRPG